VIESEKRLSVYALEMYCNRTDQTRAGWNKTTYVINRWAVPGDQITDPLGGAADTCSSKFPNFLLLLICSKKYTHFYFYVAKNDSTKKKE
jgi:hypothetical protein